MDSATQKMDKGCYCGITGRNPHKMQTKKPVMMAKSVLFKCFFPVSAMVRNRVVGPSLNHSPRSIAGDATLDDFRDRVRTDN